MERTPDMNPLRQLRDHGQSYWLDNLSREIIVNGELERRIIEEDCRGVTSNPAIFHQAISQGAEYDPDIEAFAREGLPTVEIYERLTVSDVRSACDLLRSVYDESDGLDGYVSLEVSPHLAQRTDDTLVDARKLFQAVGRPNVLIKIPGTPAGVPAIEQALFEGINVNVTLLFSIDAYEAVADAYLRALERRLEEGLPIDRVASVASFFLSRIDTLTDELLASSGPSGDGSGPTDLKGQAANANAKLAYASFQKTIQGDRWLALQQQGALPQRMLWASTSTKDPAYRDVKYVEPLIGPHTINTMPEVTIRAFVDHGTVETTIEDGMSEARDTMLRIKAAGIDFDRVTADLLEQGVLKFIQPYDTLLSALEARRQEFAVRSGTGA